MSKLIGLILALLGIWMGMEVYREGARNAFGGALAFGAGSQDEAEDLRTPGQRADAAVRSAQRTSAQRRNRLLAE